MVLVLGLRGLAARIRSHQLVLLVVAGVDVSTKVAFVIFDGIFFDFRNVVGGVDVDPGRGYALQ